MAIKKLYALLDHQAQHFLLPLSFTNDGDAIRWFTTLVNDESENKQLPAKYPEQFTLYRLADYDDQMGLFGPRENEKSNINQSPKELITGIAVKEDIGSKTIDDMIKHLEQLIAQKNVKNIKERSSK